VNFMAYQAGQQAAKKAQKGSMGVVVTGVL